MEKIPDLPISFRGIDLAGNPIKRLPMSASLIKDVRVMPGQWLRLRGGRKARRNVDGASIRQLHSFRDPNFPGSNTHMSQINYTGPGTSAWSWFDLATYTPDPFFTGGAIKTTLDNGYALSNPAAIANITDRPVFYTGQGERTGTQSIPPFRSYYAGVLRYFGLDAYCPTGKPTVGFALGAGNNKVITKLTVFVALYHEPTGHYSNAVKCGDLTTTTGTGTITVSNLQSLTHVSNNATEEGELFFAFFATIDGGGIGYLILNATNDGPLKAPISSASFPLSIIPSTPDNPNGWNLDLTSEAATENFPPRPMKCLLAVNGRLYGIPLNGGSGTGADFSYKWRARDLASVVWSKAPGDDREAKGVGDPTQCWPLANIKGTPNIETPIWLAPSVNGDAVIVFTPRSTFLMQETSSAGLHTFTDISRVHGLSHPMTIRMTDYGLMWVDQRNQVCLLAGDTKDTFQVISNRYQDALFGKTPTCADYVLDPPNQIDRYEVFFDDAVSLNHDFKLRDADFPEGQAYFSTNQPFTAAATLVTQDGKRHYVVANSGFHTQEAQPETGLIPTTDQTFAAHSGQTIIETEVVGSYRFNWEAITDWNDRKQMAALAVVGDATTSAALGNKPPLECQWWGDFEVVPGPAPQTLLPEIIPQTAINWQWHFKPTKSFRFLFKVGFTLRGHSTDSAAFHNYPLTGVEGDLAYNFYGSLMSAAILCNNEGNRPQK